MRVVWAVAAAVALGAGAVAAQQAAMPAPVVQAQDLTRVSPHVQVIHFGEAAPTRPEFLTDAAAADGVVAAIREVVR